MQVGKMLLDYTNSFSPNDYRKNDKKISIYKYFKNKYGRTSKSSVRLRKIDEIRNFVLHEIRHNDLVSEKYKKANEYLNYVAH